MADTPSPPSSPSPPPPSNEDPPAPPGGTTEASTAGEAEEAGADDRERDRPISDFLRRAVAAGFEVAGRGKDDLMRAAAGEVRTWLDHLDLDAELAKALTRVVVEVKAEIRFRPKEGGKVEPVSTTDVKVRSSTSNNKD